MHFVLNQILLILLQILILDNLLIPVMAQVMAVAADAVATYNKEVAIWK